MKKKNYEKLVVGGVVCILDVERVANCMVQLKCKDVSVSSYMDSVDCSASVNNHL